jgi:hypothetical protein
MGEGRAPHERWCSGRKRFGVLRSDPQFWRFSDHLQDDHLARSPLHNGLLDYTRLDAN